MQTDDDLPITLLELLQNAPSPTADTATEFGTKFFVWGTPAPATLHIVGSSERHVRGARFTYRRRLDESNREFEARVDGYAAGFMTGNAGRAWVEGELVFSQTKYTNATLTIYHVPMAAPVKHAA